MANSEARTTGDAAQASGGEYQVFLNFRGADTRYGFTDILYHHLVDAGVRVFKDVPDISIGEEISKKLPSAINNSIIYIPIFSRTYASSKWCLRELALMINNVSMSKGEKSIFPIFLDVSTDDLKLKTSLYKNDLLKHKKEFPKQVEVWTQALAKATKFEGLNVKMDQSLVTAANLVVGEVLERLKIRQELVTGHLVGFEDRVKHLMQFLDVNHRDKRLIAIFGMGGMGKTTIAKVIFNLLCPYFGKCCSFLENVRESSSTEEGIVLLQKKLLFDIVGSRSIDQFKDPGRGMRRIEDTLRNKKVLVVLDDVSEEKHIENLIGSYSFGSGSRIIITTRYQTTPAVEGFKGEILRYEMQKMDNGPALKLFYRHAFDGDFPPNGFRELSSDIVSGTGGLPLAIQVIGSLLKGREKAIWDETLVSLRHTSEDQIFKKLRISYDDLDRNQKNIFLDISCCFFNEKKTDAIYMWAKCRLKPIRGIEVLKERCLIKILDNDKLWMHDQLIALGREIVREDSQDDLGRQSRLWIEEEACKIIRNTRRKDKVRGLQIDGLDDDIDISNEEFERLGNLRFLKLGKGTFSGDFAKCHSNLIWFSWHSHIEKDFRANNINFGNLAVCKIDNTDFNDGSKAWDVIQGAQNLKVLSITWCSGIMKMPDLSKCLFLERLTLANCYRLKSIGSNIACLKSLIELKIENCEFLTDIPEEVGKLVELQHFSLSGCKALGILPSSIGKLTSLTELDLSSTGIDSLPDSIEGLVKLESFLMRNTRLWQIPDSIGKLTSLRVFSLQKYVSYYREWWSWHLTSSISTLVNLEELDLSGSNVLEGSIPDGIGNLSSLRILNLEGTKIWGIPRTICRLPNLQRLNLLHCYSIQELSVLPTSLTYLFLQSTSLFSIPNLSNLTNLVELHLIYGSQTTVTSNLNPECNLSWIGRLSRLKKLHLHLLNVHAPSELAALSHLEELTLNGLNLETLVQLPSSKWSLGNLSTLEFFRCEVTKIQLDRIPGLEKLTVDNCGRLRTLSIHLQLRKPSRVRVASCSELGEIQVVDHTESLESLCISECESLTSIGGLSYSKNLENLYINSCKVLRDVKGLNELKSLKSLVVNNCESPERLINASCTNIPDDCLVNISSCGAGMSMKDYRKEILQYTSNKVDITREEDYGEEMRQMFGEEPTTKTNVDSVEDGGEWKIVGSAKATRNRRQMRVGWTGTESASKPGRDTAEGGRARSMTSSSRDGKVSRSGKDAATTSGKSTASNSGRAVASSSRSSTITSSGRGRFSTSVKGMTSSSGKGMTKMGASLRSGTDKGSSSAKAEPQISDHDKKNKAKMSRQ